MYIKQLSIKNFKSLASAQFFFNPDVNILTGVNNSGKTTVLEALALWEECFRLSIHEAQRASKGKKVASGQYMLSDYAYISSDAIHSARSLEYGDIFYNHDTSADIGLACTITNGVTEISVGFQICLAHGWNYRVQHTDHKTFNFILFNQFFSAFPHPFLITYASPVATILASEEFVTPPKIRESLRSRSSISVLRNRIYRLYTDTANSQLFEQFQTLVSYVLTGANTNVELKTVGDFRQDVRIGVRVKLGPKDTWKELSLVGSGTLQIIEVLLGVFDKGDTTGKGADLNLLLLDEPDSHIHRDIQRRLLEVLDRHAKNTQVFLTTQNESLIRSARPSWLFHLEPGASRDYHPITTDKRVQEKLGLQPSQQIKILRSLGSESALDFLNALEAQKLVLVEGEEDAKYIQLILDRKYVGQVAQVMYWSFRGVSTIFERIGTYREVFELFKNAKTLWEKAVLLFDRDDFTEQQRTDLIVELEKKLKIPVYIWSAYTIESTILTELDKFKLLVGELMIKEGNPVNVMALSTCIDRIVDEYVKKYADQLQNSDLQKGVFERLKDKREKLQERLKISKIVPPDASIQPVYQTDARTALQNRRIARFATKDDIIKIVEQAYAGLSLPFVSTDLFERLISSAGPGSVWFTEWDEICKRVI